MIQRMDNQVVYQCLSEKTNYIIFVYLLTQEIYRMLMWGLGVNKIQVDKCVKVLSNIVKVQKMNEQLYCSEHDGIYSDYLRASLSVS